MAKSALKSEVIPTALVSPSLPTCPGTVRADQPPLAGGQGGEDEAQADEADGHLGPALHAQGGGGVFALLHEIDDAPEEGAHRYQGEDQELGVRLHQSYFPNS